MSKYQPRDKIGFFLNSVDTYFHYRNILECLPKHQVEILIYSGHKETIPLAQSKGYDYIHAWTALENKWRYPLTIAPHNLTEITVREAGKTRHIPLPRLLSETAIRLMYSQGKDEWNYSDWNHFFDVHFCFGPWHAQRLEPFSSQTFQIGYPRYDDFFQQDLDKWGWLKKLGGDPHKPTVVWLPSQTKHSVPQFMEAVSALRDQYNVFVKSHHLMRMNQPEIIQSLKQQKFTAQIHRFIDNLYLFNLADFVLADYGGSAFSALYLDKNILLLDNPEIEASQPLEHSESFLRQHIRHLAPAEAPLISSLLDTPDHWQKQQAKREWLRSQFFAPYYGSAAQRACQILAQLAPHLALDADPAFS